MISIRGLFTLQTRRNITLVAAICGFGLYGLSGHYENGKQGIVVAKVPEEEKILRLVAESQDAIDSRDAMDKKKAKLATVPESLRNSSQKTRFLGSNLAVFRN